MFTIRRVCAGLHRFSSVAFALAFLTALSSCTGGSSAALAQTVNPIPATTTALASSLNPSQFEQSVTFTATVTGPAGTPSGTVTFTNNGTAMATAMLNTGGVATFKKVFFGSGVHSITANYSGNSSFAASTSTVLSQTVNLATTATALVSSVNPSLVGQSVTFTVTVTATSGTPAGTVTFTNNGSPMGTATLNASGEATITPAFGHTGAHTIIATYSGNAGFATSTSAALTQTVNPIPTTTTTLFASRGPAVVGQSVTFTAIVASGTGVPTGTVTFTNNGNPMGSATLNSSLATVTVAFGHAGKHVIVASYVGNSNFGGSNATLTFTVNPATTTTTLASSANPALVGQSVTFTATVTATSGTPTGTVTFTNNGTLMGTATLNSSGVGSIMVAFGHAGSHVVVATYGGNASFMGSSATLTETVNVVAISTVSLSDGTVGAAYVQPIQAVGGVAPFSWRLTSGALPAGLTLGASSSHSVRISGTPTAVQANVAFMIHVMDANGQSATQGYVVTTKGTVAQTQDGSVQGKLVPCGKPECTASNVLEFLGIPYAAPPVGPLRWKPPQPPIPWTTTRDATVPSSRCMYINFKGLVVGSEDCLYLHIFISSQTPHGQPQPVMLFIHGGGHRGGSGFAGLLDFSDPPELATQGVILVTLDYRLGILDSFTSTSLVAESPSGSAGNYGLRDQIAALAWVQQNIVSFGGDPTHIMVFGMSSASTDTQTLLASPLTHGPLSQCGPSVACFSAAGMEAGAVVHGQYLTLPEHETQDLTLVAGLGCNTAADPLACLRALPAANLVAPCSATIPPPGCNPSPAYRSWFGGHFNGFSSPTPLEVATLEPDVVPVNPYDWLQQHGSPVPLLIGSDREDAAMQAVPGWCNLITVTLPLCPSENPTASPPLSAGDYANAIHAEFDPLVTIGGADSILGLYPTSNILDLPVWQLIAVDSDFSIGGSCPIREVARAAVKSNGPPVWRFIYTHTFENDPFLTPYRAFHVAEENFVFGDPSDAGGGCPAGTECHTTTPAEFKLSEQIMGYWTRFAATGNPNGSGATVWPRYDAADSMLQIDDTSTEISGANSYRQAQCDFYDANAAALSTVQ
jgi:carboxylesterase type B